MLAQSRCDWRPKGQKATFHSAPLSTPTFHPIPILPTPIIPPTNPFERIIMFWYHNPEKTSNNIEKRYLKNLVIFEELHQPVKKNWTRKLPDHFFSTPNGLKRKKIHEKGDYNFCRTKAILRTLSVVPK